MASVFNTCRLCLGSSPGTSLHDLFGQNLISMKIMSLFQLTLMQGCNWPQKVCSDCVVRLDEMCKFRKDVIDNQILIEQKYGPVVFSTSDNSVPATVFESFIPESRTVLEASSLKKPVTKKIGLTAKDKSAVQEVKPVAVPGRRSTRLVAENSAASTTADKSPQRPAKIIKREETVALELSEGEEETFNATISENAAVGEDQDEGEEDEDIGDESGNNFSGKYKDIDQIIFDFIPLNCTICTETFQTFTKLRYHYSKEHKTKGFVMCCNIKHLRRHKLYEHIQYHLDPDTFKCETCARTFNSSHNLNIHIKMNHLAEEQKEYQCDSCEKRFGTAFQLKQHLISHVDERTFQCDECSKMFSGRPHLLSHIRLVHEKRKPHACEQCGKTFVSKIILANHISSIHQGEGGSLKVQCSHCDKFFANATSMNKHLARLNVTGEKYVCPECGHESPNNTALKGHMRRNHNPERQSFVCVTCGKQFKSSKTLAEHMAMHTGTALYTCLFCPKKFNSNANKYSHQKKKHTAEWVEENRRKSLGLK